MAAAAAVSGDSAVRRELPVLPLEAAGANCNPLPFGTFCVEESARHIVDGIPFDRSLVLLGECTHGTSEMYSIRAEITKKLIEERGFSVVVFEADFPFMTRVNNYVHRRAAQPFLPEKDRIFPPWMWANAEAEEFFEWCKRKAPASMDREAGPGMKAIDLFGMDCYSIRESKQAVLEFLQEYDAEFWKEVKDRLQHLDKFKSGFDYADALVNGSLKHVQQHLQDCLTKIQARLSWGSDKYKCTPLERLSAEQNLEVVINGTEYYLKCLTEPAGSQASWGIRDQHMTLALMKLRAHFGDKTKVAVWAHNSHIGDTTATVRGTRDKGDSGLQWSHNQTLNLGQMCRGTFGADCWIIGQYTHSGTVVAADNWGHPHREMTLNPALPESTEALLHEKVFLPHIKDHPVSRDPEQMGKAAFFFNTMPFADPYGKHAGSGGGSAGGSGPAASATQAGAAVVRQAIEKDKDPLAKALADIMNLDAPMRLQRWVGVSYKPSTERQSHYGEMTMARCYDQIVFVDRTHGVGRLKTAEEKLKEASVETDAATGKEQVISTATMKRLMKEYNSLRANPPHGIEAHPSESNILEWHFKFTKFDDSPYEGGEYHGVIEFKPGYPNRAPAFRMMTPSGRFETGQSICTSASVWHEADGGWNPSWSCSSLLVGLYSFMRQESNGIGSIRMSDSERRKLAAQSHSFNMKNPMFVELFMSGKADEAVQEEEVHESVCRICLNPEGDLIAPCACKGDQQWVHLECLREWQKSVLLREHTHPKYRNNADAICQNCLEPFVGPGIPPSRHEQIVKYAGGAEIAKLIAAGNLLVSSREKSLEYVQLMQAHPEVRKNLAPWTKAVFLLIQSGKDHVLGVSMSAPLESPSDAPGNKMGLLNKAAWAMRTRGAAAKGIKYLCWNGGPVHDDMLLPVVHLPNAKEVADAAAARARGSRDAELKKILFVPPFFLFSFSLDEMEAVVAEEFAKKKKAYDALPDGKKAETHPPEEITVNVCVGCAGWGATQILGELARGGWGLVHQNDWIANRPDPEMQISWKDDFKWERTFVLAKLSPKTEYSKG